MKLNNYLSSIIEAYSRWWRMHDLGFMEYDGLDELSLLVDYYLGSKFGRAWFSQNSDWMWPEVATTIDRELKILPVRTVPPTVDEIRSLL